MTNPTIEIKKSDGKFEVYDPQKLCQSIIRSGAASEEAQFICNQVDQKIHPGMTSAQIWRTTLSKLYAHNIPVAARYGLRRAMSQIGPDGFVFEKYLATLLSMDGFHARTNPHYVGASGVEHELDVELDEKDTLHIIEAKYKNDYGLKTHVDVIMYAHARWIDISATMPGRTTAMWVVTNSEFTESSRRYAEHYGIRLLGWDYPQEKSLEDMIIAHKLYPITVIKDLSRAEQHALVTAGVLLLVDIIPYEASDLVTRFGFKEKRANEIISQARELGV